MTEPPDPAVDAAVDAWRRACAALADLGAAVTTAPYPTDEGAPAEMLEHLADQTVCWLGWEVLHADPTRPAFQRHNDLITQWGGPNADNVYRHARIEPGRRYRIRGRMHACDDFLLAIRAGFMHHHTWGTLVQVTASDRGIGPGDDFELMLGGDDPDAIELPEGAVMVSVREYYFDWTDDEPATFTIECLDPDDPAAPTPPDARTLGARLDDAVTQVTESIEYWNTYLADNRSERHDNSFRTHAQESGTVTVAKGLSNARYDFCFWDLGPDDALVITSSVPPARYWGLQLYLLGTFELVDPVGGLPSRNHTQTHVATDGLVHYVLSATDPGVPNWLDTRGRRRGLATLRWFWPDTDDTTLPTPSAVVVPVDEVRSDLPVDTPSVTPAERTAELAARQAHLRWRFRT